jgi:hypothetical protein
MLCQSWLNFLILLGLSYFFLSCKAHLAQAKVWHFAQKWVKQCGVLALGGDRVRAQCADPPAAQQGRGR